VPAGHRYCWALALGQRPAHHVPGVAGGADRAAGLPGERLDAPARVHVGHDHELVAPALLELLEEGRDVELLGEELHRAAGPRVGDVDLLVRRRERGDRLGHEVHRALDDDLGLRVCRGLQRELVAVGDAPAVALAQLHDLAAHVVVRQQHEPRPELGQRRLQVSVHPGQHVLGQAARQRQVLLGVGPELLLVAVERVVALADGHAGLDRQPAELDRAVDGACWCGQAEPRFPGPGAPGPSRHDSVVLARPIGRRARRSGHELVAHEPARARAGRRRPGSRACRESAQSGRSAVRTGGRGGRPPGPRRIVLAPRDRPWSRGRLARVAALPRRPSRA
jgi:hypothetical protein